jgi:hypothetical protein
MPDGAHVDMRLGPLKSLLAHDLNPFVSIAGLAGLSPSPQLELDFRLAVFHVRFALATISSWSDAGSGA